MKSVRVARGILTTRFGPLECSKWRKSHRYIDFREVGALDINLILYVRTKRCTLGGAAEFEVVAYNSYNRDSDVQSWAHLAYAFRISGT